MRLVSLMLVAGLVAGPALAGQPVTLKADTVDADGVVTLSDLFDGAGAAGRTPVANRSASTLVLDARAVQGVARQAGLDWANAEGYRRIVVRGDGAPGATVARGNVEVLSYARSLAAGEAVRPEDLVWTKVAAAPADAPTDADQVIGLAARRPLRAGAAVSLRDVSEPQVIKSGDVIDVIYEDEGVSLTLQGKAMASAAVGETLAVLNPLSKKVIQAVASGPGQAMVGPAAGRLKATSRAQLALR